MPEEGSNEVYAEANVPPTLWSLARRLPPELILPILELVVEDRGAVSRRRARRLLSVVAAICSDWRRLVLNSPSFWTTILFTHDGRSVENVAEFKWNILFLQRSGSAPLSIHLSDPLEKPAKDWQGPTLWEIISPQFYRCRTLHIASIFYTFHYDPIQPLLPQEIWRRLQCEELPRLEIFSHLDDMCLEKLSGHESNVSGIALHKWANVKAARFIPGVALPLFHAARLPNLRSLYLLAHWEENSDIISHLASWGDTLTSLEIRLGDIPFPLPSGSPNFPNLEHLHADTLMLATLILKNSERLESLALSLDAEEPSDALQHITHFHTLARWRQLRTLHFVDCNFTNVNVLPPWSALCSLKELEFSGCKEMPKVLKELEQSFHEDCTRNGWAENPELISSKQTGSFPCLERLKMLVPAKGKAWLPELIETHVRQLHTWRPLLIIQLQFDSNA